MMDTQGWGKALELLEPLHAQLDAALVRGDEQVALRLAYEGAAEAVRLAGELSSSAATLHQVFVELTPLPLETYEDGTVAEHGAYINLTYQCWEVAAEEAAYLEDNWATIMGSPVNSS